MYELELFYSIRGGGDGSASVAFMESKELAQWDQDHMDEGWGESCNGSIKLKSETPITSEEDIETKEQFLVDLVHQNSDYLKDFIQVFYPDGIDNYFCVSQEQHNLIVS